MSKDYFECVYELDDGYVGSRPYRFRYYAEDVIDMESEDDIEHEFTLCMEEDFNERIYPYPKNLKEFVEWYKEKVKEKGGSIIEDE